MNKEEKIFRVQDEKQMWHMTKDEIETCFKEDFKIINMLGYCPKCKNFSTESDLDGIYKNKIVCVLCGFERSFEF